MRNTKKPIQLYRGTTQQHSDYAGPVGEITVDTEKYTVVVQNGVTGGVPLAREDTVVSLTNRIAVEESARATADTALQKSITDEASARETADTALQNDIASEASARETADTTLQNNIASEASVRATADTAIQKSVTDEVSARKAADTALQKSITDEASAREATDNTLRRGAVIGEIRWFAMSTPPEGWLVCNGAIVFTSNYAALFAAIGKTFTPQLTSTDPDVENPEYSDPTVFRLPNLMGKVPWGSTSVGTVIDAGAPDISGHFSATDNVCLNGYADKDTPKVFAKNDGCFSFIDGSGGRALVNVIQVGNYSDNRRVTFSASSSNNIYGNSDTVQPPALCLLPCIRYE